MPYEHVMVRNFSDQNKPSWMAATVVEKLGRRHYTCQLAGGRFRKCHVEQMLPTSLQLEERGPPGRPTFPKPSTSAKPTPRRPYFLRREEIWISGSPVAEGSQILDPALAASTIDHEAQDDQSPPEEEEAMLAASTPNQEAQDNQSPQEEEDAAAEESETEEQCTELGSETSKEDYRGTGGQDEVYSPCPVCNQDVRDTSMAECTHCLKWVHYECAGIGDSVANDDAWKCPVCLGSPEMTESDTKAPADAGPSHQPNDNETPKTANPHKVFIPKRL